MDHGPEGLLVTPGVEPMRPVKREVNMPFMVVPTGDKFCVHTQGADKKPTGKPHGCHSTRAEANAQMSALYVHVPEAKKEGQGFIESFVGILKGLGQKAVWSTAKVNDLPDSCFLHIEPGGKKDEEGKTTPRSLRHFPYKDASGQVDMPHLRNAIARIPQSNLEEGLKKRLQARAQAMLAHMNEGKAVGMGMMKRMAADMAEDMGMEMNEAQMDSLMAAMEDHAGETKEEIMAAMKKRMNAMKKDLSLGQQESVIREAWYAKRPRAANGQIAVEQSWPWVREVFDNYIICDGKTGLLKVPYGKNAEGVIDFGDPVKVEIRYQEVKGKALIVKQADGSYRWFGWVSNHFRDKDNPPEIISGKAHKEFVSHAEKTGQYPALWLWHVPGSKVGKADWLDFAEGFLLMSGLFDSDKAGVAERLAESRESLTMSHGFWRLKADKEKAITERYRMVEASITPAGVQANPWTRFSTAKEVEVLTPKKKEFLTKFLGAELVTQIEADTDTLRKAAEEAGVDWKEVEAIEEPAGEPTQDAKDAGQPTGTPALDTKAIVDQMVPALVEALGLKALSDMIEDLKGKTEAIGSLREAVTALQGEVKALKADDDTKISAKMTPKVGQPAMLAWMHNAASKSQETIAKDDDPVIKQKPAFEGFVDAAVSAILSGNGS